MIESTPFRELLADADQVYVGIRTSKGPHVTPELFTVRNDQLICMTAATTLKAKSARRDPLVAVGARAGSAVMSGIGRVDVLDPARPASALTAPLAAGIGAAQFVKENAMELAGAVRDALGGRLGLLPPHRVLLTVTVDAATIVDGDAVTMSGAWEEVVGEPGLDDELSPWVDEDDPSDPDLSGLPDHLAALVEPGDVMLGWLTEGGVPLVLPGRWEGNGTATVSSRVFEVTGAAAASKACATFDAWSGLGPSGKQGLLLRGEGQAGSSGDDDAGRVRINFTIDRITAWDGVENKSVDVDSDE